MTVVKYCATLEDAWLVRNFLENEGIEADILDEATANSAPYLLNATGIRLSVADENAAAARAILGLPVMEDRTLVHRKGTPGWLVLVIVAAAVGSLVVTSMRHSPVEHSRTETDRNGDGRIDARQDFGRDHQLEHHYLDDNFDGKWDTRSDYSGGVIAKKQRDLDFDGTFDTVDTYQHGILQSELIAPGGGPNPLSRSDYRDGVLEQRWEDPGRDGAWDTLIRYDASGKEIDRKSFK